ncbi:MAG: lysylphosphatidylglycerol synthase domain-containing protein [Solirubrobacteraceae bacterium]
MRGQIRPFLLSALATAIAAVAVLVIARVTGADQVGRAFDSVHPGWIALIGLAELIAYPAYMLAYRSVARLHGHPPLALPLVARVVIAGFGPFSIGGGFGIDRQALEAIHEDEHSARVRVLALGVLEWTVLAPTACITAIVLLATGANIMPSLLWPWAIAVPLGFGLAVWISVPHRAERLCRIRGVRRRWVVSAVDGLGAVRTMVGAPHRYWGAWLGTGLYWAADIAAFYGGLRTFGLDPGVGKIIIAYATGYVATRRSLPLGGAGVTEALMTYALYWVRQPLAPALAAVVAYRVFNFLLAATPDIIAHYRLQEAIGNYRRKSAEAKVPG